MDLKDMAIQELESALREQIRTRNEAEVSARNILAEMEARINEQNNSFAALKASIGTQDLTLPSTVNGGNAKSKGEKKGKEKTEAKKWEGKKAKGQHIATVLNQHIDEAIKHDPNLSKSALATKAKVPHSSFWHIIGEGRAPTKEHVQKILKACGVDNRSIAQLIAQSTGIKAEHRNGVANH